MKLKLILVICLVLFIELSWQATLEKTRTRDRLSEVLNNYDNRKVQNNMDKDLKAKQSKSIDNDINVASAYFPNFEELSPERQTRFLKKVLKGIKDVPKNWKPRRFSPRNFDDGSELQIQDNVENDLTSNQDEFKPFDNNEKLNKNDYESASEKQKRDFWSRLRDKALEKVFSRRSIHDLKTQPDSHEALVFKHNVDAKVGNDIYKNLHKGDKDDLKEKRDIWSQGRDFIINGLG